MENTQMEPKQEKENLLEKWRKRYRLVVVNDNYEERRAFSISRLNILSLFLGAFLLLFLLAYLLFAFTPFNAIIPGVTSDDDRRMILNNQRTLDSLVEIAYHNELYLNSVQLVLRDSIPADSVLVHQEKTVKQEEIDFTRSAEDSIFRAEFEKENRYRIRTSIAGILEQNQMQNLHFFPPLRGKISQEYNSKTGHFGIDLVPDKKDEGVKATMDGTVIMAGWTRNDGYVVYIQHAYNLVSVYKHNSSILKEEGEQVKAGEIIAIVGNSGEHSHGLHLHFELWKNGRTVDPKDYLIL